MIYAKSGKNAQTLENHLLAVGLKCLELTSKYQLGKNHKQCQEIRKLSALSGLLHDIGKMSPNFQKHIHKNNDKEENDEKGTKKKDSSFSGPYHNELSWYFFNKLFNETWKKSLLDGTENNPSSLGYLLYWHHAANVDNKTCEFIFNDKNSLDFSVREELSGNDIAYDPFLLSVKETVLNVINKFEIITEIGLELNQRSDGDVWANSRIPEFNYKISSSNLKFEIGDEALKKSLLIILIEADILVSQMNDNEAKDYIKSFKIIDEVIVTAPKVKKLPISDRTQGQIKLAELSRTKTVSIIGADTGIGKTAISLLSCNSGKVNIILPKINQVDALDIESNFNLLYDNGKDLKIQRIHSGSEDDFNDNKYDYRISVFDQIFSSLFDRRKQSLGIDLMSTDLVIDEFHEFATIPSMIIPLKVLLTIRRLLPLRTLLLSGTPDLVILDIVLGENWKSNDNIGYFPRTILSSLAQGEDPNRFIDIGIKESIDQVQDKESVIISTNSIRSSQKEYSRISFKNKLLCHSDFTGKDLDKIMTKIKTEYGRNGKGDGIISSPKMLSSSYDISVKKMFNEPSVPSIDCQLMGRNNRFLDIEGASFSFIINNEKVSGYVTKALKMPKTHINWKNFLIKKLNEQSRYTHRDIGCEIYDAFFEIEKNRSDYSEELVYVTVKGYEDNVFNWFPKKGFGGPGKKSAQNKKTQSRNGFRGTSSFSSLMGVAGTDRTDDFQLINGDCISISESTLYPAKLERMKDATKVFNKINESVKNNDELSTFKRKNYPKMKKEYSFSFGYSSDCPFIESFNDRTSFDYEFLYELLTKNKDIKSTDLMNEIDSNIDVICGTSETINKMIYKTMKGEYRVYSSEYGAVRLHDLILFGFFKASEP